MKFAKSKKEDKKEKSTEQTNSKLEQRSFITSHKFIKFPSHFSWEKLDHE